LFVAIGKKGDDKRRDGRKGERGLNRTNGGRREKSKRDCIQTLSKSSQGLTLARGD